MQLQVITESNDVIPFTSLSTQMYPLSVLVKQFLLIAYHSTTHSIASLIGVMVGNLGHFKVMSYVILAKHGMTGLGVGFYTKHILQAN